MAFLRRLVVFIVAFNSFLAFSQNTICIKGYVISETGIMPDVSVSIAKKNVSTYTIYKGRFRIQCSMGDTLIFENKYSNYKLEKYCVRDSSLLIIKLIQNVTLNSRGRSMAYGYAYKLNRKSTLSISGSISDKTIYGCGYSYFPEPFFPDEPFLPVMNNVSFGLNISNNNSSYYLFPNIGLSLRNNYRDIFDTNLSFSLSVPSVKVGYWIADFKTKRSGFGYEFGITLVNFNLRRKNLTIELLYNSYLTANGTFILSLNLHSTSLYNRIPKFIKNQISK